MDNLDLVRHLQEGILKAVFVNESCVIDLKDYLKTKPDQEFEEILNVLSQLQEETGRLKELSNLLVTSRFLCFAY
ncbi:hypothetical protein [Pseudomonas canadensis]|uniref:hypothetical protein n=1 Tax=Pseudomonas canadensis TaxID=915099 RepID=UPI002734C70C|nr:hypothetical protein [Pseudomonas canadensis]WLH29945.1 hypothetical protein PSH56_28625 [Pseudomonas canadensis]